LQGAGADRHAARKADVVMRLLVAAAGAACLVHCTRSLPQDDDFAARGDSAVRSTAANATSAVALLSAPHCPPNPDPAADASLPIAHVVFPDAAGAAVDAEVASTEAEEDRGLMYRTSMPEDHGMLFELGSAGIYEFWMHDTCIPLDMIFADQQGLIVGIVENAPPLDDTPRGVGRPSVYVLEVNGGWSSKHRLNAGQRMAIRSSAH
jgi:uncharacterized membrane protein (UPF0127 family)